jgi:hypothetical protein
MDTFLFIVIFILVFLLYIHIFYQFKKSEDFEIYEIDYTTNANLQEICDLKQPILFQIDLFKDTESFFQAISLNSSSKHEVRVKDIRDYHKSEITIESIALPFSSANQLMMSDTKGIFLSENNSDFIQENELLLELYKEMSLYFSPSWNVNSQYDFIFGAVHSHIPMKYHTNSQLFLIVSEGSGIRVKMSPWKSRTLLSPIKDYETYEFRARKDVWKPDGFDSKFKCLDFDVKGGYCLFVPAYWWYSFEFLPTTPENPLRSSVASFMYNTPMNLFVNIPNYTLFFLQNQNIQTSIARTYTSFMNIDREKVSLEKTSSIPDKFQILENEKDISSTSLEIKQSTETIETTKEDPSIQKIIDVIRVKPSNTI